MTVKDATRLIKEKYGHFNNILDIGDAWVFSICGDSGEELDMPPIAVNKKTGGASTFFPPDHLNELQNAVEIQAPLS